MDMDNLPFSLDSILIALTVVVVTTAIWFKLYKKKAPAICDLKVYPVKSCAPIQVTDAIATALGFEHDRIAQVSDSEKFNYCTPRDPKNVKLFQIKPAIHEKSLVLSMPGKDHIVVNLAGKQKKPTMAIPMTGPKVKLQDYGDDVAKWLQSATGIENARLTGIGAGYKRLVEVNPDQGEAIPEIAKDAPVSLADEAPYLLTSTTSLQDLNKRMKSRGQDPVNMQRFRPNIVISGLKPWEEDCLKRIRLGYVEFHVWQRCGRCAMTTIDRDSLERSSEPLATLSTFRERAAGQRNFGMHLIPVVLAPNAINNKICVGDKLEILEYDEERKAEWERLFG
jgi:uncharacterized protein YcbX